MWRFPHRASTRFKTRSIPWSSNKVTPHTLIPSISPSSHLVPATGGIMSSKRRAFKRSFQPSIDTYFNHLQSDHADAPTQSSISSPSTPAFIQSSLLNVGMRVRKAVPEGYKTKPLLNVANADPYSNPSPGNQVQLHGFTGSIPYSGIFDTGAYEAQAVPGEADISLLRSDDGWSCPSSQESNFTDAVPTPVLTPIPANSKRRRSEEDQENECTDYETLSQRSGYLISHTKIPNLNTSRVIANPKTRKLQQHKVLKTSLEEHISITNAGDFEEADFFRAEEWAFHEMEF